MAELSEETGFIDLHSHTTESDGSLTPEELVDLALRNGLKALAITDHDTFSGYEQAVPYARAKGLKLIRGIELNSRLELEGSADYRAAHILGLFPIQEPSRKFQEWVQSEKDERRERNRRLAQSLQQQGVKISLEEVEARGRSMAGRTHFAQILLEKGYVDTFEAAFQQYLGRGASTYVERESQTTETIIGRIRDAGGVSVVAHPIRLSLPPDVERREIARLKRAGLVGLEVIHSDQSLERQRYYRELATDLELAPSGGSDFHGAVKPNIELGWGFGGNVRVPASILDGLYQAAGTKQVLTAVQ